MRKRRKQWLLTLLIFTILQFGFLFALDRFLKPPDLTDVASYVEDTPKITSAPAEAVDYLISEDGNVIAYTTANNELVIADVMDGEIYREVVGNVTYLHWLGTSGALLYMVEKTYSQKLYLLQTINLKMAMQQEEEEKNYFNGPKLLRTWNGTQRTIENVYFSPYVEFFNLHVKNGMKDELYKYKANTGLYQIPISFRIQSISYDDRKDVMTITTVDGEQYEIEDIYDVPVNKTQKNNQKPITNNNQSNNHNNNNNYYYQFPIIIGK